MGGSAESNNQVILTLKEHFIVHHLLIKFTTGDALKNAYVLFWNCCNQDKYAEIGIVVTPKTYNHVREKFFPVPVPPKKIVTKKRVQNKSKKVKHSENSSIAAKK